MRHGLWGLLGVRPVSVQVDALHVEVPIDFRRAMVPYLGGTQQVRHATPWNQSYGGFGLDAGSAHARPNWPLDDDALSDAPSGMTPFGRSGSFGKIRLGSGVINAYYPTT